jgi:hypothetical protein
MEQSSIFISDFSSFAHPRVVPYLPARTAENTHMPPPDGILDTSAHHNGATPLPLFRPEAILHQQQKSYGEIILIRPLSLTLFTCLALVIIALAGAFLLLGRYTEKARVSGALLAPPSGTSSSNGTLRAELYVPARWLASVQPGTRLVLRCRGCSSEFAEQPATVVEISAAPSSPGGDAASTKSFEPSYKVTLSLPPQAAQLAGLNLSPQTRMPVEADLSLGRKPLIKWLFEPSGS